MNTFAAPPVLMWFREDLRVDDNRALQAAIRRADARGSGVHAVWCVTPAQWDAHGMGDNRRAFLLGCVRELMQSLAVAGIPLHIVDAGDFSGSVEQVMKFVRRTGATDIHVNEEYPLNEQRRDAMFERHCGAQCLGFHRHHDAVLVPPARVLTKTGTPYSVFTPYRQNWYREIASDMSLLPKPFSPPALRIAEEEIAVINAASERVLLNAEKKLSVPITVLGSAKSAWKPGETEARRRLKNFMADNIRDYANRRDLPAQPGTSSLSPYLAAGCLSPRRALHAARRENQGDFAEGNSGVVTWISELAWRDFYRQVIFHHPHVSMGRAFRRDTDSVRWRHDEQDFNAWCNGETGVPLVDAAMKQLVATGWMHNRLRMVAAMFLSKDLLIDWRLGERFFAKHLVDWDFAANNGGWQWSASTGTDAAPYFRLFNPVRQGERFDPDGRFVRAWLPALKNVPDKFVHSPWRYSETKNGADFFGANGFPPPLIEHKLAKARVMAAFRGINGERETGT